MNEQERQQAFIKALQAASKQFGFDIKVTLQAKALGNDEVVIVEPALNIVSIAGWIEPEKSEE